MYSLESMNKCLIWKLNFVTNIGTKPLRRRYLLSGRDDSGRHPSFLTTECQGRNCRQELHWEQPLPWKNSTRLVVALERKTLEIGYLFRTTSRPGNKTLESEPTGYSAVWSSLVLTLDNYVMRSAQQGWPNTSGICSQFIMGSVLERRQISGYILILHYWE